MNLPMLTFLLLAMTAGAQEEFRRPDAADIAYGPDERQTLDLWTAKSPAPTPLLIFIHGGGWHGGNKTDIPQDLLRAMLRSGVSVASVNYRFTHTAPLPAPQRDVARAVQFLRSRAGAWNLNPDRFAAYGVSAGGCTALWLALHDDLADAAGGDPVARQSTRLCAAVGISPQTCLEPALVIDWIGPQVLAHPMIARAVKAGKGEDIRNPGPERLALLREASPIHHLSAGDPPLLISNPRRDPLPAASPGEAIHHAVFGEKLREKAALLGVPCILRIEDRPDPAIPAPADFLLRHLLDRR